VYILLIWFTFQVILHCYFLTLRGTCVKRREKYEVWLGLRSLGRRAVGEVAVGFISSAPQRTGIADQMGVGRPPLRPSSMGVQIGLSMQWTGRSSMLQKQREGVC